MKDFMSTPMGMTNACGPAKGGSGKKATTKPAGGKSVKKPSTKKK